MTHGGWGGQPKMTDDNDGSLRWRGFTYLDKNEGKKHVFAEKYFKNFYMCFRWSKSTPEKDPDGPYN